MIALRAGYQTNRALASWSAEIGLNKTIAGKEIEVNYSYSKMDIFKNVNRLSI